MIDISQRIVAEYCMKDCDFKKFFIRDTTLHAYDKPYQRILEVHCENEDLCKAWHEVVLFNRGTRDYEE